MMTAMLILFDIDGTILSSEHAGIKAILAAGREMFGEQFTLEGVEISGRLDPLIWADAARINNIPDADVQHQRFRETYGKLLQHRLSNDPTAKLLPGVKQLVRLLSDLPDITLGLLTGNYPETGRMKVSNAGLNPDLFEVAAWGCDGDTRRDLPVVAMTRYEEHHGRSVTPDQVVVIGDTPHDVDCARFNGCRSIGVATGSFSVDELREAGADLAVENLMGNELILDWLLEGNTMVSIESLES